jgi:ABC-type Fe3+ transport system substrate-binding protein
MRHSAIGRFNWLGALGAGLFATSALFLAGCNNSSTPATNTASNSGKPADSKAITIISPHPAAIQSEFNRVWNQKNPDIKINWLDQGGSSDDLKFVKDQFATNGKEKGIGIDLFFGGGPETFTDLEKAGLLTPLPSNYSIPAELNGAPLHGKDNHWVAAALSGFGILYNKQIAARDNLPIPKTWADLSNPKLLGRVQLADPRHSGSAHTIYEIILQTNGWDKGWKILTAMAGNSSSWAQSSSAPLQDVQNGEAVFCVAIDFYAYSAIAKAGEDKLGYISPSGQNLITADPIGMLAGAANPNGAKKFVEFVLSPEGQKLWFLKKGAEGGPKDNPLYRMPALPSVYKPFPKDALIKVEPYSQKSTIQYSSEKSAKRREALNELIGVVLVDDHDTVKAKWKSAPDLNKTGYVPLSEADFEKIAANWSDPVFAGGEKDKWTAAAREFFGS